MSRSLDLPPHALRCLHSALADWLDVCPSPNARAAMLDLLGGDVGFDRFRLALIRDRLIAGARVDDDDRVTLTLCVPEDRTRDWHFVELDPGQHAVSAEWLRLMGRVNVELGLAEMFGGSE